MSPMEVNMTYEPFSKEPEYIVANQDFLRSLNSHFTGQILDLASGTGAMTDLMLEVNPDLEVVSLDISRESLLLAQEHFKDLGILNQRGSTLATNYKNGRPKLFIVQATADILPLQDLSFDAVIMGNSIHLLQDEKKLLAEVHRVLRPGHIFAFNSSFYAGTMPRGTERFHHEWVKQAAIYIKTKDEALKKQGLPGISRKRGTARRAFSKRWPSIDEWTKVLNHHGFDVKNVYERTVMMNQRCFEGIGAYAGLASVLFTGYPVDLASEALQETVGIALSAVGMEIVPRLWLEVTAAKA